MPEPVAPTVPAASRPEADVAEVTELVEVDVLVEEISIDGMCGVY